MSTRQPAPPPSPSPSPPPTLFKYATAFESWLKKRHARSDGLGLQIAKRGAGQPSVFDAEAVATARCWGWIDGQRIQTAVKPETPARRIARLVSMLARGETIHIFKPKTSGSAQNAREVR